MTSERVYVGFGFGAIQAGLFLYEAARSRAFDRLVVAEVVPAVVEAVRRGGGSYALNIAHLDRVETVRLGPIEIENPARAADRERLVAAIAAAAEIGTAIPSVKYYVSDGPGSLHRVLAEGLRRKAAQGGPRAVVYTAENNNCAAEILERAVLGEIPEAERAALAARVRFLNTVVGKMSGILTDPREIRAAGLATVSAEDNRAFLVEAFNRILITKIQFPEGAPFARGLRVFEEKTDLLPFEEAKLHGHNATHALAAYLALALGLETIAELPRVEEMMDFLRAAFIDESGAALIKKYQGFDPLFTAEGYRAYAEDLLARMTNPHLLDRAERVGRDPRRKLAWDDRLIGTMRLALSQGIQPERYALGAAAALLHLDPSFLPSDRPAQAWLEPLWREAKVDPRERERVLELVEAARVRLARWRADRRPIE